MKVLERYLNKFKIFLEKCVIDSVDKYSDGTDETPYTVALDCEKRNSQSTASRTLRITEMP